DESVAAALVNFPLSERSAVFVGAFHVSGAGDGRASTAGAGADAYFGPNRELELFGEAWFQSGRAGPGVTKRAWAGRFGGRYFAGAWSAEVSTEYLSGDGDPADGRDEAFQSYEGRERFQIVESAEFGLDWDSNLASFRAAVERKFEGGVALRLDAGRFRLPEEPSPGLGKDLGTEIDVTLKAALSPAVETWAAVAALLGSDALEAASRGGDDSAVLAALGIAVRW
ncbi:MAG TPA: hypothetical protein VJU16_03215, partial [Planctomycetota bacterium]|nr:hypothetical protein [Planctomycetota bacterium]